MKRRGHPRGNPLMLAVRKLFHAVGEAFLRAGEYLQRIDRF